LENEYEACRIQTELEVPYVQDAGVVVATPQYEGVDALVMIGCEHHLGPASMREERTEKVITITSALGEKRWTRLVTMDQQMHE